MFHNFFKCCYWKVNPFIQLFKQPCYSRVNSNLSSKLYRTTFLITSDKNEHIQLIFIDSSFKPSSFSLTVVVNVMNLMFSESKVASYHSFADIATSSESLEEACVVHEPNSCQIHSLELFSSSHIYQMQGLGYVEQRKSTCVQPVASQQRIRQV